MKRTALLLTGIFLIFSPAAANADYQPQIQAASVNADDKTAVFTGMQHFNKAYAAYSAARSAGLSAGRGNFYAEAIKEIAKARAIENENLSYMALSMQIYRGKGVLPYAKNTFLAMEKLLEIKLAQDEDNAAVLLDYAILCRAGDMAYRPEKETYFAKSQELAQKVCNRLVAVNEPEDLFIKAMANLVLGKEDLFLELLKKSVEAEGENGLSSFYLSLYNDTVKKGEWLWPTADIYLQNEFMLYYLSDLGRYSTL